MKKQACQTKKWLLTLCVIVTLMTLTALLAVTASAATSGYYTYSVSGGEATITDVDDSISGDVTIPSTLGGYPVTNIGDWSFFSSTDLSRVIIPDGVRNIGNYAFSNCYLLESVEIPSSVAKIGDNAFSWCCLSLTSVKIPSSVKSIGLEAFSNCDALKKISFFSIDAEICDNYYTIPNTATIYCYQGSTAEAYAIKYGRTFFTIDEEEVGTEGLVYTLNADGTAYGVDGYWGAETDIVIPSKYKGLPVTSIDVYGGSDWFEMTSIRIPATVTSISYPAFFCEDLQSVTVDSNNPVYRVENNCLINLQSGELIVGFENCKIPTDGRVKCIGARAFYNRTGLVSLEIPSSVTSIGFDSFYGCTALTSITIPSSMASIGDLAFACCDSLTSITILSPDVSIYDYSGTISDTATIYGYKDSTAEAYATKYGRKFEIVGTEGLAYTLNADSTEYSVTDYVGLVTEIVIPNKRENLPVTSVDNCAFSNCSDLASITFLSKTIEIYDSTDTIPQTAIIYGYMGSTAEAYATKYSRTFVALDGAKINTANISLGSDITVYYYATLPEQMKDAVMEFKAGDKTATVKGELTSTPNRYVFAFEGITPQMIGDNISVRVLYNHPTLGEFEVASHAGYSVKQYCLNMKRAGADALGLTAKQYATLTTLVADILEYGAATQIYRGYKTDALVNAGNTGASAFVPLTSEYKPAGPVVIAPAADGTTLTSAKVELSNVIKLYFEFKTTDVSRVTVKINDKVLDADDFTFVKTVDDGFSVAMEWYSICSGAISANDLEKANTVTLYVDGVECQTLQYSVVNYIYNVQNSTSNPSLVALLKCIRNYGLSAVAYRAAMGQ